MAAGDPTKAAGHKVTSQNAFAITSFEGDIEMEGNQRINMIVYGPYGSGKTTLMATAADVDEMSDVLMIDIESGKLSIKDSPRIKNKGRIDTARVTDFKQTAHIIDQFLRQHIKLRDDPAKEQDLIALEAKFRNVDPKQIKKPRRYNTVIVDSLTELDKLVTYELLGFSTAAKLTDMLSDGDMDVAEFKEYKQVNQMMQIIVRAFRDLDVNSLFVVQEAYVQDELKRMLYSPALTGRLGKQVQGMVDIVGYLQVGTPKEGEKEAPRRLWVQPQQRFDAKSRMSNYKESFIDHPEMQDIWDAVNGE